jgi:hypothetical protein
MTSDSNIQNFAWQLISCVLDLMGRCDGFHFNDSEEAHVSPP